MFIIDISGSFTGSANFFKISASISAAYSKETSVKSASSTQSQQSGSLTKTEVQCLTTRVHMKTPTLHPTFMADLLQNRNNLGPVVQKYGTHYYLSAEMGGKLVMMSSISRSLTSSTSSSSVDQSTKMSFSAKVCLVYTYCYLFFSSS